MTGRTVLVAVCVLSACVARAGCAHEDAPNDEGFSLDASAFLGLAIDTFSAGEYGNYVYPGDDKSSATGTEGALFSVSTLPFACAAGGSARQTLTLNVSFGFMAKPSRHQKRGHQLFHQQGSSHLPNQRLRLS